MNARQLARTEADPLVAMSRFRRGWSFMYAGARARGTCKSFGYALLEARTQAIAARQRCAASEARMISLADGCVSAAGHALAAWKAVA